MSRFTEYKQDASLSAARQQTLLMALTVEKLFESARLHFLPARVTQEGMPHETEQYARADTYTVIVTQSRPQ